MTDKHIAIVGYGSAALIILKMLQDLPYELRRGWRVTIYERREGLGGQWLPDDVPSTTPLTGLYPELRTNTPVNMMTFPYSMDLFPEGTDLFPHWTVVLRYLQDYAQKWGLYDSDDADWEASITSSSSSGPHAYSNGTSTNGLSPSIPIPDIPLRMSNTPADIARKQLPRRILTNRELYTATWVASTEPESGGKWKVISKTFPATTSNGNEFEDEIDVIIDATGHLVHPAMVHWQGEEEWLAADKKRSIMHSAFYRGPEQFRNKTVVVVGAGPSGLDGSLQIARTAKRLYHSVTPTVVLPPSWPFQRIGRISHFTKDSIVMQDGTILENVDAVYLGTGFIIRYEYLERGGILQRRPGKPLPDLDEEKWPGLVSTDAYVRPLYEHTVSFAPKHDSQPSLFFVGNIMSTSYRFSNAVQASLVAWSIALPSILPSYSEMLSSLRSAEAHTVSLGRSVEKLGHRQGAPHLGESELYQRRVLSFLTSKGIETGSEQEETGVVMQVWREEVRKWFWRLMRGWMRLEKEGRTKKMLEGLKGEEGYSEMCRKVLEEQTIVEKDRDPLESEISGWH